MRPHSTATQPWVPGLTCSTAGSSAQGPQRPRQPPFLITLPAGLSLSRLLDHFEALHGRARTNHQVLRHRGGATLPIGTVVTDARMVTQDPPDALGRRVPEGTMSGDKGVEDGV